MRYFISTGELSGDLHASYLVEKILKLDDDAEVFAIGGKNLEKLEINIIKKIEKLAIMGFVEVIKNFNMLKKTLDETYDFIIENNIDRVILVDYGGFNLKLLERLKKNKPEIKVFYYIPPKIWIWGKKRIHKIKLADEILVIFPWEKEFYKKNKVEVSYFGNPFMEKYKKREKTGEKILLLPGSRKQEIQALIPYILEVVRKMPHEKFILKLSKVEDREYISEKIEEYKNLEIDYNTSLSDISEKVKYALAASGTVILELAILGIPAVVIYKTSLLNELIGKLIIKYKYVTLPNLTLDEEIYVELLQKDCNTDRILSELNKLEKSSSITNEQIDRVRNALSGNNIILDYAKVIVEGKK